MEKELGEDEMGDNIRLNSPTIIHPPPSNGIGMLAKLAIGAGLLGTGAGAGMGVVTILDALTKEDSAPVVPGIDTTLDWRLGTPIVE